MTGLSWSCWLDLLSLSLEAGLSFRQSLEQFVSMAPHNPCTPISTQFLSQLKLGIPPTQAVHLFKRAHPEMEAFCEALTHAWQQGTPLSPLLKEQAQNIRQQTLFELERQGIQKQFKLLLPIFLLILPAVFIVLFVPLFIQLAGAF